MTDDSNTTPAQSLEVRLGFRAGWCDLRLSGPSGVLDASTHWLGNGFRHLVQAVEDLLAGRPMVSVRWGDELGAGHVLDLSARPRDGLGIAVHRTSSTDPWSASRGDLLFSDRTTVDAFVRAFATELHRVRIEEVDVTTGMPAGWSYSFPVAPAQRIEDEAARRFGYRPPSPGELRPGASDRPGPELVGADGEPVP